VLFFDGKYNSLLPLGFVKRARRLANGRKKSLLEATHLNDFATQSL